MPDTAEQKTFFGELKRRNVFRVGAAYLVVAWLLMQVADVVLNNIAAPGWVFQVILLLLGLGFPLALLFAWAFELTPEGVKREKDVDRSRSVTQQTGRRLDFAIIAFLTVALGWFVWDKFGGDRAAPEPAVTAAQGSPAEVSQKSIAVLPFEALSSGPDDEYFADGLTEEILNALAQLPELLVTARTSAFHFKGQKVPIQEIAAALGVRHIVEGSVRKTSERLRVTAQLIRAADGFHLWSENYDSDSQDAISVQEDIAVQIASAMDVVLDERKREAMRRVGIRDVEAFIAFQKGEEFYQKAHGDMDQIEGLRQANRYYEAVLARVPDFAPAHVAHSDLFVHIVLRAASGQPMTGLTEKEVLEAPQIVAADLAAGVEHARTPEERHNAEFDLAFLTANWRGLRGRIEVIIGDRGCGSATWLPPVASLYGDVDGYLPRLREYRSCDPLLSSSWWIEARALLWSGDTAGALELARKGTELAPGGWLRHTLIRSLISAGQFQTAEKIINDRLQASDEALVFRIMLAAARGEPEAAAAYFEQYRAEPQFSQFWALQMNAWLGNKEEANRLAARVDSHPFGSPAQILIGAWCACGAPWELKATPNFAEKLKQAGLPWPPVSPIKFPLKDW